ncbi:alpha-amylase family glycosyl hydrolase [Anaerotalea alkaliphila]|uniref:DUF3459 domain-containing protein n=1 Tax=Anaerotalea alkaliphila TaxID=2662126 RepID=A0A7X5HYB8_9FIRM|nr:alpha-amylase family glycosyl hydrolase [Anaerotalea alkaliphila]NDL68771.1 DUF3459 domain-containing protein [Anaerotalea alkaliphila]
MWAKESLFYQIHPLGFCGAPGENDGNTVGRIRKVLDWIPHWKGLGVDALYFSPVFESDRHGYDTRDYFRVDCRLGTRQDLAEVCGALQGSGIRVVLDGVFNHVGRGFWAFQDVLRHGEGSAWKDWFFLDFSGDNRFGDGFRYEAWEGHEELVRLNPGNPAVVEHLFAAVRMWVEEFGIDGLRLDVAYCMDREFLRRLSSFCRGLKEDFFLVGEMIHGDYREILDGGGLDSCTNYECCKGLHSSLNDLNFFEIAHSLERQAGIYPATELLTFGDNHDVTRVASILKKREHLPLLYGLLFGMPGIPCLYYGSEWGVEGVREEGSDAALRPAFDRPEWNGLTDLLRLLARIRREQKALRHGDYGRVHLSNGQFVLSRRWEGETVLVALNGEDREVFVPLPGHGGAGTDLLTGAAGILEGGVRLGPYGMAYWKLG